MDQRDCHDAVHTEQEQIIIDVRNSVELLFEQFAQHAFGVSRRRYRCAPGDTRQCVFGQPIQCVTIQLAVGIHRQPRKRHDTRWNHVGRQALGETGAQLDQVLVHIVLPHNETDQAGAVLLTQDRNRRVMHAGLAAQCRLDLADLDAIAADLDLGVGAAHVA